MQESTITIIDGMVADPKKVLLKLCKKLEDSGYRLKTELDKTIMAYAEYEKQKLVKEIKIKRSGGKMKIEVTHLDENGNEVEERKRGEK